MDKVVIFGCGPTGLRTYEELKADSKIIAFLDNDEQKEGTEIEGVSVYRPDKKLLTEFWIMIILPLLLYMGNGR